MKKILLGIAILLLITPVAYSQDLKQPLTLIIKTDKQVYGVGEDIIIEVTLKNKGSQELWLGRFYKDIDEIGQQSNFVFRVFKDKSGKEQQYKHIEQQSKMFVPYQSIPIKVDEEIVLKATLNKWYVMSKPGQYTIVCSFLSKRPFSMNEKLPIWEGTLVSSTITIEVKEVSYSEAMDEARKEFEMLKKEWEAEVTDYGYGIYSADAQYWQGKAGQAIIDMGKRALPFIIEEIKKGNHLFNYPASRIAGMVSKDWINWWEVNKNNPKWNIFISQEVDERDVDKKSGKTAVGYGE